MFYGLIPSPLGQLMLAGTEGRLRMIGFPTGDKARGPELGWRRSDPLFADAARQIGEYFAGERRGFDLPLAPEATPFQAAVLAELRRIPYGETRSYGEIARQIGRPAASRAVGAANGRNPLPIVIPCHRVVGRDGALTGFGGGLAAKRYLLELERRNAFSIDYAASAVAAPSRPCQTDPRAVPQASRQFGAYAVASMRPPPKHSSPS